MTEPCQSSDPTNGELGAASAWHRRNGLFEACEGFDWDGYWNPAGGGDNRRKVKLEDLAAIFDDGERTLKKKAAVERLKDQTGLGRSVCYDALKLAGGEFSEHLEEFDGFLPKRRPCWPRSPRQRATSTPGGP